MLTDAQCRNAVCSPTSKACIWRLLPGDRGAGSGSIGMRARKGVWLWAAIPRSA
jgi:hypothetical protein